MGTVCSINQFLYSIQCLCQIIIVIIIILYMCITFIMDMTSNCVTLVSVLLNNSESELVHLNTRYYSLYSTCNRCGGSFFCWIYYTNNIYMYNNIIVQIAYNVALHSNYKGTLKKHRIFYKCIPNVNAYVHVH